MKMSENLRAVDCGFKVEGDENVKKSEKGGWCRREKWCL